MRAASVVRAAALLGIAASCGCYYVELARGQVEVLYRREPVLGLDHDPRFTADEQRGLQLLPEIRRFARAMGLVPGLAYTTLYDPGGRPVSWNLSACRPDRLRPYVWTYPIIGEAPYRGFFDREEAEACERDLAAEGWDTFLYGVSAYSTLGWFEDPIFRSMLDESPGELAATVLHELVHRTIYRASDTTFSESLAEFLGTVGARAFLVGHFGGDAPEVREWDDRREDERTFEAWMQDLVTRLEFLYAQDLGRPEILRRRADVFEGARERFARIPWRTDTYEGIGDRRLNNAIVLAFRRYHTDHGRYARVLAACGGALRPAVRVFEAASLSDDPEAWLDRWLAPGHRGRGG